MAPSTTNALSNLTLSSITPIMTISNTKKPKFYDYDLGSFYGIKIEYIIIGVLILIVIYICCCLFTLLITCCALKSKNPNPNKMPNKMQSVDHIKHKSSLTPKNSEIKMQTQSNKPIDRIINDKRTKIRHPIAVNNDYKSYCNYPQSQSMPNHRQHRSMYTSNTTQNKTISKNARISQSAANGINNNDILDSPRSEASYMSTEYKTEWTESDNYIRCIPEYAVMDTITTIVNKSTNQKQTIHVLCLNKLKMSHQQSVEPSSVTFNKEPSHSLVTRARY